MVPEIEEAVTSPRMEAVIQKLEAEEKLERIASFTIPFIRSIVLTITILCLFNYFVAF